MGGDDTEAGSEATPRDPAESFDPEGADPDPIERFQRWAEQARAAGSAMSDITILATASPGGLPSARALILRGLDRRGFVFFTNYESPKARDLEANPIGALVFLWPEVRRQVRVTGRVERVSKEESEAYFRGRPPGHRRGAWASPQSRVMEGRGRLEQAFEQVRARFPEDDVPLPPFWGGYRMSPEVIEFWEGRDNRLHDRVRYRREGERWTVERLAP